MTLTMAWVRDVEDYQELIICSDSRLRFGCAWDSCQKVFPFPRGDCAISFAGDTMFAYPFIHAAINAVTLHRGSSRRQVDLVDAKSVLLNAINAMLAYIQDLPSDKKQFDEPELRLIFGGYSWRKKKFIIWKFHFNEGEREFRHSEIAYWRGLGKKRMLIILGDPEASPSAIRRANRQKVTPPTPANDVQLLAKEKLIALLDSKGILNNEGLDMEPLEVLRDMLRDNASPHIGGAPQVVKVYQHMNAQPFGMRWPSSKEGRVAVLGRLLPHGEKMHIPILDPDTFKTER